MDKKYIEWFISEIPQLVGGRIISGRVANSLKAHYLRRLEELEKAENPQVEEKSLRPEFSELTIPANTPEPVVQISEPEKSQPAKIQKHKKTPKLSVSVILSVIAAVLIAFGIISLIAYNWAAIPRIAKATCAILLLVAAQTGGFILIKTGRAKNIKVREGYSIFWALLFGGIFAFILQIFKFSIDSHIFILTWAVSTIIITYLFSAYTTYYLSLLFSVLFLIFSWDSKVAFLIFPLCASLYVPARKSLPKFIPLIILSIIFFILRTALSSTISEYGPGNIQFAIICFLLLSTGLICINKNNTPVKYIGFGVITVLSLITIFTSAESSNYIFKKISAYGIIEFSIIVFIALGVFAESSILPLIKKIRNKEKLSLEHLLYLLPVILSLNILFPAQTKIIFHEDINYWYKIFYSPFTLTVLFTSLLFIIYALKKSNLSWLFLAFNVIESLRTIVNSNCVFSFICIFSALIFFVIGTVLLKNNFSAENSECRISFIVIRIITSIIIYAACICSETFRKSLYLILLCFIPSAVFGLIQFVRFAKKDFKRFLQNIDIPVNIVFSVILVLTGSLFEAEAYRIFTNIIMAVNLFAASILVIKYRNYSFTGYKILAIQFFIMASINSSPLKTIIYFACCLALFDSGIAVWKNRFTLNENNKNILIITRIVAVISLFITNLLVRLSVTGMIDIFTLCAFTPAAIAGLIPFVLLIKNSFRDFFLNLDILVNLIFSAVILIISNYCGFLSSLYAAEILTSINFMIACLYLIKEKKYEYIFNIVFASIYFVFAFYKNAIDLLPSLLYMTAIISIFITGTLFWKNNFIQSEENPICHSIFRILSFFLLLIIGFSSKFSNSFFYTYEIKTHILISFLPAGIFGIVLYGMLAKKDFICFLKNLDLVINSIFVTVILLISPYIGIDKIIPICKITLLLNLIAAFIHLLTWSNHMYLIHIILLSLFFLINTVDGTSASEVFFLISMFFAFLHLKGVSRNRTSFKVISTLGTGIILFYETCLRNSFESEIYYINFELYDTCFIFITCIALVIKALLLLSEKNIINPGILLTPFAVLLLTVIPDDISILITFPLLFLYCMYYFYYSYKTDSVKLANLSTIYFGIILMIRFALFGYGLVVQGITLICMGIFLLAMNIYMTKRNTSNDE